MKRYDTIPRKERVRMHYVGDIIEVTEKLDGANASIKMENGVIKKFSRNMEVTIDNDLRGFYRWVDDNIDINLMPDDRYIIFGEWLVSHRIKYKEEFLNEFYAFDVYDCITEKYLSRTDAYDIIDNLGLRRPKVLFYGGFISYPELEKLVGVTEFGIDGGEGIVIRSLTRRTISKWVRPDLREIKDIKMDRLDPSEVNLYLQNVLTIERVRKILCKGFDEGIYKDFNASSYGDIIRYTTKESLIDILEEENEGFDISLLKGRINKIVPGIVKKIIGDDR